MRLLYLFFSFSVALVAAAPSKESIADAYIAAHKNRDITALMALGELSPETPASMIEAMKASLQHTLTLKIVDVRVLPLDEEDQKSIAAMRATSEPTLEPVAKLVVRWDMDAQTGPAKTPSLTRFLGIKDGEYRFIAVKRMKPNQPLQPTPTSVTSAADAAAAPAAGAAEH